MPRIKKAGAVALMILALASGLSLTSHLYITYRAELVLSELEERYTRDQFTVAEIGEDIAYLQSLLERVHPSEIPSFPLGNMGESLTELGATINRPRSRLELYRELAPVANLLNDEHTMVFPVDGDIERVYGPDAHLFPFNIEFIEGKLYVAGSSSDQSGITPGTEIISINGVSAAELRETLITFHSGTGDEQKLFYAQENFRQSLFLVFDMSGEFEVVFAGRDSGETVGYSISGKVFAMPEVENYRYDAISPDTILFTYNAFEDEGGEFSAFLQEMFSTARQQDVQHLIIDIRCNQGGASAYGDEIVAYLTDKPFTQLSKADVKISKEIRDDFISYIPAFIRWFPVQYLHPFLRPLWTGALGETVTITLDDIVPEENELRFNGNVYLLTGPGTMSSASLFAATLRKYQLATMVGEAPGGYATMYGNVIDAYLPNTGLKVWMPTSVISGNGIGQIEPDHVVRQTVPDLVSGTDTVLEYARGIARRDPIR